MFNNFIILLIIIIWLLSEIYIEYYCNHHNYLYKKIELKY